MATYRKLKYKKSEKAHDTKSVVSRDFVTQYGVAEPNQVAGKVFVVKGQAWKITRIYKKKKNGGNKKNLLKLLTNTKNKSKIINVK